MLITLKIAALAENQLEIQWQENFAQSDSMRARLAHELDKIHGVEHVDIIRYSALVVIAPHVTNKDKILPAVIKAFNHIAPNIASEIYGSRDDVQFEAIVVTPILG